MSIISLKHIIISLPALITLSATAVPTLQPYKYNGKELDRMHGLDWYDYGARMYDAVLTGWTSIDPLAEDYYHVSPYAYCLNNPVNAIDPDGRDVYLIIWSGQQNTYGHAAIGVDNYVYNEKDKYVPDGILKIKTSHNIDVQVRNTIQNEIDSNQGYRGVSRNCSTFVRDVLKVATGKEINGEENWLYYNYVTPNKLYKETKELPNVDELLNPGDRINYDFINILNIFK